MTEKKFPFRKEFIKVKKTRRTFRQIEIPFDYQLGAVLIIDSVEYPIYNIWPVTNHPGFSWYTFANGRAIYFTEQQILTSTVYYTKLKD